MAVRFSRWSALGLIAILPAMLGAEGRGCDGPTPNPDGGTACKADSDCPVLAICRLCPDGSCANPNVRCVDGACTAPNYTCPGPGVPCASSQECGSGEHCTTEDGECNPPPGCDPSELCPAVCYGVCAPPLS